MSASGRAGLPGQAPKVQFRETAPATRPSLEPHSLDHTVLAVTELRLSLGQASTQRPRASAAGPACLHRARRAPHPHTSAHAHARGPSAARLLEQPVQRSGVVVAMVTERWRSTGE